MDGNNFKKAFISAVENKPKFDWDEFSKKEFKIAVNCKSQKEADIFCLEMYKRGMRWRNGESYSKNFYGVKTYRKGTAYSNRGTISSYKESLYNNDKTLQFSDYDWTE